MYFFMLKPETICTINGYGMVNTAHINEVWGRIEVEGQYAISALLDGIEKRRNLFVH